LLSSGYIAGGAIAGIIIAVMSGLLMHVNDQITKWSTDQNPFYSAADWNGLRADVLTLIPFVILIVLLCLTGCERLFAAKPPADRAAG